MRWRMVTGVLFIATLVAGMATCAKAQDITSAYHLLPDCRKFANRDFSTATNNASYCAGWNRSVGLWLTS